MEKEQGSKAPKGHGPGPQVMPGANRAPSGCGKGKIGKVIAENPLTLKIRSPKK